MEICLELLALLKGGGVRCGAVGLSKRLLRNAVLEQLLLRTNVLQSDMVVGCQGRKTCGRGSRVTTMPGRSTVPKQRVLVQSVSVYPLAILVLLPYDDGLIV